MEKKPAETKKKEVKQIKIERSKKLISFKEFFAGRNLREERKAAFKISLDGKLYHSEEEWKKLLDKFEG